MTENNEYGCHFVGYFSKEKRPSSLNNVSCILVLPIHQRKGYGQFLIEFSYLLTRVEKKTGSPEKPLSDMGLVSYRTYWRLILCTELVNQRAPISITEISERTGMTPDDIVSALEGLRALVRDPYTKTYALRLDYAYFKQYIEKCAQRNHPRVNPDALVWTPYVMGRTNLSQYEDGPAIHTVQPREGGDDDNGDGTHAAPEEGVQLEQLAAQHQHTNNTNNTGSSGAPSRAISHTGSDADPATPDALLAPPSQPGTPLPNGTGTSNGAGGTPTASAPASAAPPPHPASLIPPARFEVFPPIPGMPSSKRRAGRPFGSRRRTSTPVRRGLAVAGVGVGVGVGVGKPVVQLSPGRSARASPSRNGALTPSGSVRRTRSKLGEMVNGVGLGEEGEDEEEDEEEGVVRGGEVRSVNGSPKGRGRGRGKIGRASCRERV